MASMKKRKIPVATKKRSNPLAQYKGVTASPMPTMGSAPTLNSHKGGALALKAGGNRPVLPKVTKQRVGAHSMSTPNSPAQPGNSQPISGLETYQRVSVINRMKTAAPKAVIGKRKRTKLPTIKRARRM